MRALPNCASHNLSLHPRTFLVPCDMMQRLRNDKTKNANLGENTYVIQTKFWTTDLRIDT